MEGAKGGTFAPEGMGKEFVNRPRKALADYVGASQEFAAFPGGVVQPWDPLDLSKLTYVSGNNPDVAFMREAELKHGRMSMLAFAGILVTNGGVHLPGNAGISFEEADWTKAWGAVNDQDPAATGQVLLAIALIEGVTSKGVFGEHSSRVMSSLRRHMLRAPRSQRAGPAWARR